MGKFIRINMYHTMFTLWKAVFNRLMDFFGNSVSVIKN